MLVWINVTIKIAELADSFFGEKCPNCGKSSYWLQKDEGETFFMKKRKIKCGHCRKIFKLERNS